MFKLIVTPHRGTSTEHDFATFAELRRYAVDVEGVPMTAFTSRIGGRPRTSHTFHGCVWNWAEVAGTPAPLDIPAAVTEYIEAEYRGAALVMSAKRGEILAALLAADPELSATAATFRFHKLVDEYRGNGEISPETLARMTAAKIAANDGLPLNVIPAAAAEPVYVTVAGRKETGLDWHLCDRDGQPVTAGEHTTDTGLNFTIAATPDASCDFSTGEPVRIAVTYRGAGRVAWIKAEMLVTGWHWQAERV